jgi:hypothetical protein
VATRPAFRRAAAAAAPLLLLQGAPPRYSAAMLSCAAYTESIQSDIQSQTGRAVRRERGGRDGVLIFRAAARDSALETEAWYDTLSVWREGPEGRVAPDASGLFGGRYRGLLGPDGRYAPLASPFVPDEVAEIAELGAALDDFLPRLPDHALRQGERYAWTRHAGADTSAVEQDTLRVPVIRQSDEEGWLLWDARRGPVEWQRTLTLSVRIEAQGAVKRALRSVVSQRIHVTRGRDPGDCPGGPPGA